MEKRAFFNSIINDTATFIKTSEETIGKIKRTTKVFAKAGLDDVTSAMCYYQQWFELDVQRSAFIF